mmetsp:Transcript_42865/g.70268  ORF Transcript_42865/g.70268 Transcript_42865/m.70268 type:complete len:288 (-) Transcript_42865:1231-2094(-)
MKPITESLDLSVVSMATTATLPKILQKPHMGQPVDRAGLGTLSPWLCPCRGLNGNGSSDTGPSASRRRRRCCLCSPLQPCATGCHIHGGQLRRGSDEVVLGRGHRRDLLGLLPPAERARHQQAVRLAQVLALCAASGLGHLRLEEGLVHAAKRCQVLAPQTWLKVHRPGLGRPPRQRRLAQHLGTQCCAVRVVQRAVHATCGVQRVLPLLPADPCCAGFFVPHFSKVSCSHTSPLLLHVILKNLQLGNHVPPFEPPLRPPLALVHSRTSPERPQRLRQRCMAFSACC